MAKAFIEAGAVRVFNCYDGNGQISPFWFSLSRLEIIGQSDEQFSVLFLPYKYFDGSGQRHTMATPIEQRLESARTAIAAAINDGYDLRANCKPRLDAVKSEPDDGIPF